MYYGKQALKHTCLSWKMYRDFSQNLFHFYLFKPFFKGLIQVSVRGLALRQFEKPNFCFSMYRIISLLKTLYAVLGSVLF